MEELEDRHERVVSTSLLALSSLLDVMTPSAPALASAAPTSGAAAVPPRDGDAEEGTAAVTPPQDPDNALSAAADHVASRVLELLSWPDVLTKSILRSKSRMVRGDQGDKIKGLGYPKLTLTLRSRRH